MKHVAHVTRVFSAAHAIVIAGEREPVHGHDWRVVVSVGADALDRDGLVCDFHALEAMLDAVLEPMRNRSLNEVPPFDRVNPTAERVAEHIGDRMLAGAGEAWGGRVRVLAARVTEAPGCEAEYRPGRVEVER